MCDEEPEADWRRAITAIAVPMLQGAAVHTAVIAEEIGEEQGERRRLCDAAR